MRVMAGFIPDHKIDEVRSAVNIVELIGRYVSLKQAGRVYKGLCPFHAEKTPSFVVNPERGIFHCFGCGVGGNIFRFLMLYKSITFPEAVTELAEAGGVLLPRVDPKEARRQRDAKSELYRAVALALGFFTEELYEPSGRIAREYFENRGLSPDLQREFQLGWAPPGWDNLARYLASRKVSAQVMEKAGLVRPRTGRSGHYDTFRARVICPIFDLDGKPTAFGGRLLEEEENQPKYLNSPETPIYHKGRILYGLDRCRDQLRRRRTVFIVEGYFDLLSLAAQGVVNVVATLGTALTENHLRLLKGYVNEAVLLFDADEAGRSAAARALPLFMSADLEGRVLSLPDGHDPDTFIRQFGPRALEEAAGEAVSLLDFYLEKTLAGYPDTLAGKSRATQEVLRAIEQVEGRARQDLIRQALAERMGISENALLLSQRRQEIQAPESGGSDAMVVDRVTEDIETGVLKFLLLHQEACPDLFAEDLHPFFRDETCRGIYEALKYQYNGLGDIDLSLLVERLTPEESDLVTGLASGEDGIRDEDLSAVTADYINRFRQRDRRFQTLELSKRIKKAQESGDEVGLVLLLKEKSRLLKESML